MVMTHAQIDDKISILYSIKFTKSVQHLIHANTKPKRHQQHCRDAKLIWMFIITPSSIALFGEHILTIF